MQLTSSAFEHGQSIAPKYTCEGENLSPPLKIQNVPLGAKSLVLICDDPDAATDPHGPGHTFDHWLVWNIPPVAMTVAEGSVPRDAAEGKNSLGRKGYTGPCPPTGEHRYFSRLYAIDTELTLNEDNDKEALEAALAGHVLVQTELVGTYQKQTS